MTDIKEGQRVEVVSTPEIENQHYQKIIDKTIGKIGTVLTVYKNGQRNIYVRIDGIHGCFYYQSNNLK